jgi:tetratricopeptide (TPR) repeat protein
MLLAVVRANQVWACGAAREEGYGEARAAAARVVELVPERVEPHLLEIIILVETGAIEEAFERVLVTRARFPDSILPRMSEAFVLRYAGFLGRAEQRLREALALDPLVLAADASGNVPNTLLYAGKVEEFLALVPATGTPYHRFYQGYGEMLLGRPERAREVLRPAFRDNPADLFARFAHALLAVLEGDHAAARAIVRQIALQRRELGAVDGEITYKQAQLLALAGDRDAALEQLALAVEQGFFNVPFLTSDPLLASLRADPSYARTVAAAGERHQAFGRRFGLRQ